MKINPEQNPGQSKTKQTPTVGILEWFHYQDYDHVKHAVDAMKKLGVKHLRTGISWADYHRPEAEQWYDWLVPYLSKHLEVLPCFLYTPPSIGIVPKTSSPPKKPKDYADFIDQFLNRHGKHFNYVELWNEPNNRSEYDYVLDSSWNMFAEMIRDAAYWAKKWDKKTVLGGMSPIDPNWLRLMIEKNVLQNIDVVGIHGFPDVFDSHWGSWEESIDSVAEVLHKFGMNQEIWITETGYSTWRFDEKKQINNLIRAMEAPVERVYWYSLTDLPAEKPTVDGHFSDEREYHFGMIAADKRPKLLYRLWSAGGIENIHKNKWMMKPVPKKNKQHTEHVLITGGAGFIGTNLAARLLEEGFTVTVYDNLSRPGVENNLEWLQSNFGENLNAVIADVRDTFSLNKAVNHAGHVFHLAAQVAVTTSLLNPVLDYKVNLQGTLNLLEAIRKSPHKPSLIYTSTNKVYGNMNNLQVRKNNIRYHPVDKRVQSMGVNEQCPLDFHSPYGSSKGSADQYVLDYSRSYGLRNIVFRMSCIYGPHQFGTEDQGWVAHFILRALQKEGISIFGDGMQVRDILYVEDLVNAFMMAWKSIEDHQGEAFNMGGGPENTISLLELIQMLEELEEAPIPVNFQSWRKGDQKYYVSDSSKFQEATGWKPEVHYRQGIRSLYKWLKNNSVDIKGMESLVQAH